MPMTDRQRYAVEHPSPPPYVKGVVLDQKQHAIFRKGFINIYTAVAFVREGRDPHNRDGRAKWIATATVVIRGEKETERVNSWSAQTRTLVRTQLEDALKGAGSGDGVYTTHHDVVFALTKLATTDEAALAPEPEAVQ